ncbi:hypothetical protein PMAYCL1PPCAC_20760, partial [Pristionchus mayeri]
IINLLSMEDATNNRVERGTSVSNNQRDASARPRSTLPTGDQLSPEVRLAAAKKHVNLLLQKLNEQARGHHLRGDYKLVAICARQAKVAKKQYWELRNALRKKMEVTDVKLKTKTASAVGEDGGSGAAKRAEGTEGRGEQRKLDVKTTSVEKKDGGSNAVTARGASGEGNESVASPDLLTDAPADSSGEDEPRKKKMQSMNFLSSSDEEEGEEQAPQEESDGDDEMDVGDGMEDEEDEKTEKNELECP